MRRTGERVLIRGDLPVCPAVPDEGDYYDVYLSRRTVLCTHLHGQRCLDSFRTFSASLFLGLTFSPQLILKARPLRSVVERSVVECVVDRFTAAACFPNSAGMSSSASLILKRYSSPSFLETRRFLGVPVGR